MKVAAAAAAVCIFGSGWEISSQKIVDSSASILRLLQPPPKPNELDSKRAPFRFDPESERNIRRYWKNTVTVVPHTIPYHSFYADRNFATVLHQIDLTSTYP